MQLQNHHVAAAALAVALSASLVAQNDDCTGALPVTLGANGPFDNLTATTSAPAWPCAIGGNDVWFVFQSPLTGNVTINTCTNSSYDTALQVFDGSGGCGALSSLGCNDDFCGLRSQLIIPMTMGGTYYIRVGGYNGARGSFELNIGVPSTSAVYGRGCVGKYETFYETFTGGNFDLSNTSLQLIFAGNGYIALPGGSGWHTPAGTQLTLSDDSVSGPQSLGFTLPYPGGSTTDVYVSSNGFVWAQPSTNNGCCNGTPGTLLTLGPRWAPNWGDLNPATGGTVHFDSDPVNGVAYVTFTDVPEFGAAANRNTFQVAFFNSGVVEYRYQTCRQQNRTVLVGWSPGNNNLDPGSRDISASLPIITEPDSAPLSLAAASAPVAGTTISMVSNNIRPSAAFGAILASLTQTNLDLTAFGMPGCSQLTGGEVTLLFFPLGATSTNTPFQVPNMLGLTLHCQSVIYDPIAALTPLGAYASNGVTMTIGNF